MRNGNGECVVRNNDGRHKAEGGRWGDDYRPQSFIHCRPYSCGQFHFQRSDLRGDAVGFGLLILVDGEREHGHIVGGTVGVGF